MNELTDQIRKLTDDVEGEWAVVLEDMDQQKTWEMNEDNLYYAASVIKLPIMAAAYKQADQGNLVLGDYISLEKEDIVAGSGVLQHLTPGLELSVHDLLMLMIIQSDNTATNMMIDLVGTKAIQKSMIDLDMASSSFYNKLMTVPVDIEGRNMITATDVANLLNKFVTGKFVSVYACEQMIDIMKRQQLLGLGAHLPGQSSNLIGSTPKWEVASKSGSVTNLQHDAGIFYVGKRTMTVTVLSKDCQNINAKEVLAQIGEMVYDYMVKTQPRN